MQMTKINEWRKKKLKRTLTEVSQFDDIVCVLYKYYIYSLEI